VFDRQSFFAGATRFFQHLKPRVQTALQKRQKCDFLHHFLHHLKNIAIQTIDNQTFVILGVSPASSTSPAIAPPTGGVMAVFFSQRPIR